ncbi:MAG: phosphoribosylanthranilate isomerase [Pseudomonadota bacterium]
MLALSPLREKVATLPSVGRASSLIKICGLKTAPTVDAAVEAGADMLGFNFVKASPRYVPPKEAKPLVERAFGKAKSVGLFADTPVDEIKAVQDILALDYIQLHGSEPLSAIEAVREATGAKVILAKGVSAKPDLPLAGHPDFFLFDAKPPKGEKAFGGHGQVFDWSILDAYAHDVPWLLAGGLTADNVADAITACKDIKGFSGVDVSSGVEKAKGEKDLRQIVDFVAAARAAMGAIC